MINGVTWREWEVFKKRLSAASMVAAMMMAVVAPLMTGSVQAATCTPLPSDKGTVTSSVNFATTGTYRAWVRMLAPSTTENGVYLQVADSDACQVTVGKGGLAVNQLMWVNWRDGNAQNLIDVTVSAGTHQVVLAGLDEGVQVDRLLFLTDKACVPTGDGSNCMVTATPTPALTPTVTPTPTPTPIGDVQAPTAPTEFATTNQTDTSIALAWKTSTDNVGVKNYQVKRNGQVVGNPVGASFIDAGLMANTAYNYSVSAFDAAGNQSSAATLVVSTKPALDTAAPSIPTGVTAQATSPTSVTVSWAASTDNVGVTGYYVLRNDVVIAQGLTATTYVDATAVANTSYSYIVKARDAAGNVSVGSTPVNVTTPQPPDTQAPSVPAGVSANAVSANQVNLSWAASTDNVGVAGYAVKRNGQELAKVNSLSFGDTGLTPNTTYQYTVVAYDAAGNMSAASTPVSVTTTTADVLVPGGLNAIYYDGLNFSGATVARLDRTINFDWGRSAPIAGIEANTFSTRWVGKVYAPQTGSYTFYTRSDDGVRLWVNGKLLVNNWTDHSAKENKGALTLTAGQQYDIKMEYYENRGSAVAQLRWSGPGISKQIVPSNVLYHR